MKRRVSVGVIALALGMGMAVESAAVPIPKGQKAKERAIKAELEKLQGTWTLVSYEAQGQQVPNNDKRWTWTFTGNKWVGKRPKDDGGLEVEEGTLKIVDVSKTPKWFDVVYSSGPYKGTTYYAIIQVEGDTLKCCYNRDARPTAFGTKEGDNETGLGVYKRAPKKGPAK
jgi:uncharacterized protein (TIGR03067 family)